MIDDKKYGLPRLKKFPMSDAAHVKSAIRFFNYVTPANEKELANNILARMQEYDIDVDDINVGDNNRFKKYLVKNTELKHHGIKGQKWGVRRPRNQDGIIQGAGKQLAQKMKAYKQERKENKESRHYNQVNKNGSTNKGHTKNQQRLRKVGKAAAIAALSGAAGYALVRSGAVQNAVDRYKAILPFDKAVKVSNTEQRVKNAFGIKTSRQRQKEQMAAEEREASNRLNNSSGYRSTKSGPSDATRDILDANQRAQTYRKVNNGTATIRSNGEDRPLTKREKRLWNALYSASKKAGSRAPLLHDDETDAYLAHHGIKGQKWGVRRFQNPDGSYTSQGKSRRTLSKSKGAKTVSKYLYDKWNPMDPKIKKNIIKGAATLAVVGGITAYGHSKGGKGVLGSYMTGINDISQNNPLSKAVANRIERKLSKNFDDYDLDNMGPTIYRKSDGKVVNEDDIR